MSRRCPSYGRARHSVHPPQCCYGGRVRAVLRVCGGQRTGPPYPKFGSSMFLMRKPAMVAERHRKLARHNVPGKVSHNFPRPGRTLESSLFSSVSAVPSGTDSVVWRFPGTLSPANFRCRSATIECPEFIYPLQTSKNPNLKLGDYQCTPRFAVTWQPILLLP